MTKILLLVLAFVVASVARPAPVRAQGPDDCFQCVEVGEGWECDVVPNETFNSYHICAIDEDPGCELSGPCFPTLLSQVAFDADGVLRDPAGRSSALVATTADKERSLSPGQAGFHSGCLIIQRITYSADVGEELRTESATIAL